MEEDHRMPVWVKVFVGLGILLLIAVGAVLLGGSDHGPGRHAPAEACGDCPAGAVACHPPCTVAAWEGHCAVPCLGPVCLCEAP